jgi:hypothetical protein
MTSPLLNPVAANPNRPTTPSFHMSPDLRLVENLAVTNLLGLRHITRKAFTPCDLDCLDFLHLLSLVET